LAPREDATLRNLLCPAPLPTQLFPASAIWLRCRASTRPSSGSTLHDRKMMQWQQELVSIAAPPFGEGIGARSGWRNASGSSSCSRSRSTPSATCWVVARASAPCRAGQRGVMLSAHIDTVFPLPHADCAAGGAQPAGGARALATTAPGWPGSWPWRPRSKAAGSSFPADLLFAGNVGEEGEGDLRGMRYLYGASPWRRAHWRQRGARRRGLRSGGNPGPGQPAATWSLCRARAATPGPMPELQIPLWC
jgi:hypothetical protein